METDPAFSEVYISVDIETAGPNPNDYSLLTIGACTIAESPQMFYVEIQPVNSKFVPEALAISRLSMERLEKRGLAPKAAMAQFDEWVRAQAQGDQKPVFVAFNAAFDWMFVNDYFHTYLGHNPFGHKALDVKAFFMGLTGACWHETSMDAVSRRYVGARPLTHHALQDAIDQAEIFRRMLAESQERAREFNR